MIDDLIVFFNVVPARFLFEVGFTTSATMIAGYLLIKTIKVTVDLIVR